MTASLGPVRYSPLERDRVARALEALSTRLPPPDPQTVERMLGYFRRAAEASDGARPADAGHTGSAATTAAAGEAPGQDG